MNSGWLGSRGDTEESFLEDEWSFCQEHPALLRLSLRMEN